MLGEQVCFHQRSPGIMDELYLQELLVYMLKYFTLETVLHLIISQQCADFLL